MFIGILHLGRYEAIMIDCYRAIFRNFDLGFMCDGKTYARWGEISEIRE